MNLRISVERASDLKREKSKEKRFLQKKLKKANKRLKKSLVFYTACRRRLSNDY